MPRRGENHQPPDLALHEQLARLGEYPVMIGLGHFDEVYAQLAYRFARRQRRNIPRLGTEQLYIFEAPHYHGSGRVLDVIQRLNLCAQLGLGRFEGFPALLSVQVQVIVGIPLAPSPGAE